MPTYEYICEKCGHQFETVQPISSKPLTVCPPEDCAKKRWGRGKVKRAISAGGGLLFKGSGFYITDYRSDGYKAAAKKESPPAKPESKPAAGGETKPAAKPEAKPSKPPAKT
jgi:putative FmdB family regulatory protein